MRTALGIVRFHLFSTALDRSFGLELKNRGTDIFDATFPDIALNKGHVEKQEHC